MTDLERMANGGMGVRARADLVNLMTNAAKYELGQYNTHSTQQLTQRRRRDGAIYLTLTRSDQAVAVPRSVTTAGHNRP